MQLRSWKIGTVACALVLAALGTGCDSTSSVTRKDAAPDAVDARTQADSAGDSGRNDATADSSGQTTDSPRAGDSGGSTNDTSNDPLPAIDTPVPDLPTSTDGADVPQVLPDATAIDVAPDMPAPDAPVDHDTPTIDATTNAPDASADASHPSDAAIKRDGLIITIDANNDAAVDGGTPAPFQLAVAPSRMLDLVFLIDNSPSMAPKQQKLKAQFPKLIDGLRDPSDGSLPDLRVAIIDSDLGTGGAYASGSCGPKTLADGTSSNYGDLGRFQMVGAQTCGVTSSDARWLEHKQGQPVNYTGDISAVFSCLATNLGTLGCGEEHSLQAFEFALVGNGIGNDAQHAMLRPAAYLGLVFLSDEDDCSAATNDGLFGMKPGNTDLSAESASLRCATRAHACNGTNLSDAPPGYPTTAAFSTSLANCAARTDACPSAIDGETPIDVSVPTTCSPLRSISRLATELKALKSRPEQVFVAGIFGWPTSDIDVASATYKIGPVPNPNAGDTAHPTVFDAWPVCYDPNHLPQTSDPSTFDTTAASYGGAPGLRLSAFVDAFGDNGMKFSICQPDYTAAMTKIAGALSKKMQNLCLPSVYSQLACPARYLRPDSNGALIPDATTVPACNAQKSNAPCYALATNESICPAGAYVVTPIQAGDAGVESLPYGTLLEFRCP